MKNKKLYNLLANQGKSITFAESITGGKLAAKLIEVPGASKVIKESYICYNDISKQEILGISKDLINRYGVVSKEVAEAMNSGLKEITKADVYVSITGNAGPTYQNGGNKLQVAFVAVECGLNKSVFKIELTSSSRVKNIKTAVSKTYDYLIDLLETY